MFARVDPDGLVDGSVSPAALVGLLVRINDRTISSTLGKTVLGEMIASGNSADEIIAERGLAQISDRAALEAAAERVIEENPKPAADYRAGKESILKFLVGQLMKATQGKADPVLANEVMREKLNSGK